ncbi:hypothetical protein [Streptomyces sp. NPDC007883]|uniref:hypothetical protein n=1 Tax=Streptomyces sp. NPDC007883 TaxID=3155116 RepID=UPI0033FDEE43
MTGWGEEFAGLMERAGLEIVGDWPRDEDVLAAQAAWRPVAAMGTEPAATVRYDRPDLVPAVNAQWHRLAVEYGVIGADGVFLVDVADSLSGPGRWVRVRLGADWDLAGVLSGTRTIRITGCVGWRWTTRTRRPSLWSASAGIPTGRCGAGRRRTRGCRRRRR